MITHDGDSTAGGDDDEEDDNDDNSDEDDGYGETDSKITEYGWNSYKQLQARRGAH